MNIGYDMLPVFNKTTGFFFFRHIITVCESGGKGKDPCCVFPTCLGLHCRYFLWVSLSGFGSSFLPKEESVTAAPEVEASEDYQASSQVSFISSLIISDIVP